MQLSAFGEAPTGVPVTADSGVNKIGPFPLTCLALP